MEKFFFLDGNYCKKEETKISVLDLGILRGYGVFEFVRTYEGKFFHLKEHFQRFRASASKLGLSVNYSDKDLEEILYNLMKKNQLQEAYCRMVLTGGVSEDHFSVQGTPSLVILIMPPFTLPNEMYQKGVPVTTYVAERFLHECKSLNYLSGVLAQANAKKVGAFDAIYVDKEGYLLEATTSNFFAVKNGVLITPKEKILEGVTRRVVLHLAKNLVKVETRKVYKEEISQFDEAFLTSTTKKILPICSIDGVRIGKEDLRPITKDLSASLDRYAKDPQSWKELP